jgi:hypothetical protein
MTSMKGRQRRRSPCTDISFLLRFPDLSRGVEKGHLESPLASVDCFQLGFEGSFDGLDITTLGFKGCFGGGPGYCKTGRFVGARFLMRAAAAGELVGKPLSSKA